MWYQNGTTAGIRRCDWLGINISGSGGWKYFPGGSGESGYGGAITCNVRNKRHNSTVLGRQCRCSFLLVKFISIFPDRCAYEKL